MDGYYIGRSKNAKVNIGNGSQVNRYLSEGYAIYWVTKNNEKLVAEPEDKFYEIIYSETGSGDVVVATPDTGWMGVYII